MLAGKVACSGLKGQGRPRGREGSSKGGRWGKGTMAAKGRESSGKGGQKARKEASREGSL
jgi:hypothetical protein